MIILGVDPGTIITGFGIINFVKKEINYKESGIIKPSPKEDLSNKLKFIYKELSLLIKYFKPDVFCIETAFYGKNVQSAMKIGYVRGVAMVVAANNGIAVAEYSPREIKKAVVGNGAASKEQVQYMIRNLLNLEKEKIKLDETDALAAAVCHSMKMNSFSSSKNDWKSFIEKNPDRIIE
jgi:crossover junction endodeoxyribonuclease RuvC